MLRQHRSVIILFLVALVLRLAWVLSVSRDGFAWNDAYFYQSNAYNIGHGRVYGYLSGAPSASWPPGYPAVLSVLYRVFGNHEVVGQVFNALLGAVTVPLLHALVRPRFGARVALIAATMLCVMPGPILWTDMILTETFYTMLLVVYFLLLMKSRPTWLWALGLGCYIGLVAMTRSEGLIWAVLLPVMWRRELRWKAVLPRVALAGAMVLLVLTPWAIRNTQTFHTFVPLSTNAGGTLYAGHNPSANGMQNYPSDEFYASFPPGDDLEVRTSKELQRMAFSYMLHHPVRELVLIPEKLLALSRGDSYAFEWLNQEPYPTVGPVMTTYVSVVADFAWFTLLALTLIGAVGLGRNVWRDQLMRLIAAMFVTALFLYGFLYYGNYRYRLPYEPLMMVVAALVIDRGWRGLQAARAADVEAAQAAEAETADAETGADAS